MFLYLKYILLKIDCFHAIYSDQVFPLSQILTTFPPSQLCAFVLSYKIKQLKIRTKQAIINQNKQSMEAKNKIRNGMGQMEDFKKKITFSMPILFICYFFVCFRSLCLSDSPG